MPEEKQGALNDLQDEIDKEIDEGGGGNQEEGKDEAGQGEE